MDPLDIKKRLFAAHGLLNEETTTKLKFERIKTLLKGINPRIDKLLDKSTRVLSDLEKLHKGEIIELTAENLPEDTTGEKKRKKILLLFIQNWKSLRSEVERVQQELEKDNQTFEQKVQSAGRIVSLAKGPLGLITAIVVIAVISFSIVGSKKTTPNQINNSKSNNSKSKTQVIIVDNKQIPLSEVTTGQGPECMTGNEEAVHYHAKNHTSVTALDGDTVNDPGGCGFGKVSDTKIIEIVN